MTRCAPLSEDLVDQRLFRRMVRRGVLLCVPSASETAVTLESMFGSVPEAVMSRRQATLAELLKMGLIAPVEGALDAWDLRRTEAGERAIATHLPDEDGCKCHPVS